MDHSQGHFPFPFYPPFQIRDQKLVLDNEVPARVQLAAVFLQICTRKMTPTMIPSQVDGGRPDIVDGLKLTDKERAAQDAAAELLMDYFKGQVELDAWEYQRSEMADKETRRDGGRIIVCPFCQAEMGDCKFCDRKRFLVVYPSDKG